MSERLSMSIGRATATGAAFLVAILVTGGCVTVEEKRTVIDGRQDRKVEVQRSTDDPPRAQLTAGKDGTLVLVLTQTPRCIERMLVVTAQDARTEREAVGDGWFDGKTWYAAPVGLGVLGGAWTALGVAGGTATPPPGHVIDQDRVTANLAFGIGALLVAGTWTGIELYRLRTTVEPMDPRRETETKDVACNPAPFVHAKITLSLNGTALLTEVTDQRGEIHIKPDPFVAQIAHVANALRASWPGGARRVEVTEEALWVLATHAPRGAGYSAYLAAFPDGNHRHDAEQALDRIDSDKRATERRADAAEARGQAEKMLRAGDLEEAWAAVTKAEELGGDVGALKVEISEARTKKAQEHLKLAWKLAKRDRPDQADEEYAKAVALGAEDDDKLAEAIENTPTARRRRAQEERRQRQAELAEQRRQRREAAEAEAGKKRVCAVARKRFNKARFDVAVGVTNYLLQGKIDPYQQAANLMVAMRVAPGESQYFQSALARSLNADLMVHTSAPGPFPSSSDGARVLGAMVQDRSRLKPMVKRMRNGIYASLATRAPGEFPDLSEDNIEDHLLGSIENFERFAAVVALAVDVPADAFAASMIISFCGKR